MAATCLVNNTILKPSCSSSSLSSDGQSDIPYNNDVLVPLTIFDKAAMDLHFGVLYAFKPPMPSNEVMKEGLSKVLVHYPHLAGRFTIDDQGQTCIILNNAGVRVTETCIPITLIEQLPFDPTKDIRHLCPMFEGVEELFQVQLNRYACGGVVISLTAHHHVADGQSMSSFFVAWAKIVRGLDIDPVPYHDRFAISVPRNPPKVEFDHRNSIKFKKSTTNTPAVFSSCFETLIIHYTTEFITKIKAEVIEQNNCIPHQKFSTFECLLSHAWKKVTQARGLDLEEFTQVKVAVNGRARIKPAVPMEYFGNLVLWAYPKLKVKDVLNESLAYIAKAIHDEVARVDDRYFKSFIDFGDIMKGQELEATTPGIGNTLSPNLEVDSWLRFQFHDIDFGGGGPCAFFPPNLLTEGVLIFFSSCKEEGGVDLALSLLPEHVHLFKQISHSMD